MSEDHTATGRREYLGTGCSAGPAVRAPLGGRHANPAPSARFTVPLGPL